MLISNAAGTNGAMKIGNAFSVRMVDDVLRGGTGSPPQLLLAAPNTGTQFQLIIEGGSIGFSNTAGGVLVQPQGSTSVAVDVTRVTVQNLQYGLKFNAAGTKRSRRRRRLGQ